MKTLIAIALLFAISLQADKILISGISYHGKSKYNDDYDINPYNYGLGYQKELDNNDTITALIINDSFRNTMVSLTYGLKYKESFRYFDVSYGAEFGVTYKKIMELGNEDREYKLIPTVFVPSVSISKNRWSLDIVHVPEISYDNIYIMRVTLFLIGYKFD